MVVRIIGIRDSNRCAVTHPLGEVESSPPRIGLGNHHARERVPSAPPLGAISAPEIARVFSQEGGEKALGHHIADGLIGVAGSESPRKSSQALSECRMLI